MKYTKIAKSNYNLHIITNRITDKNPPTTESNNIDNPTIIINTIVIANINNNSDSNFHVPLCNPNIITSP